jgi:F-type H+-transporting ATPase subunit a
MSELVTQWLPWIVIGNFLLVSVTLVALGRIATARPLQEVPHGVQNAAEAVLDWFVEQARTVDPRRVTLVAPFLATLFLLILGSNLLGILPLPLLQIPPTAYFSGPLALALVAVFGALVIGARLRGVGAAARHLFWPNPLQLVGELSHTLSLSLRLYGNIGGEYLVVLLATQAAPYGIPLIIHAFGLIPTFVQPLVFTLLTVSYLAAAAHTGGEPAPESGEAGPSDTQTSESLGTARAP